MLTVIAALTGLLVVMTLWEVARPGGAPATDG